MKILRKKLTTSNYYCKLTDYENGGYFIEVWDMNRENPNQIVHTMDWGGKAKATKEYLRQCKMYA